MALPLDFDPTNPIPNNPFYYPQTSSLVGPDGPLIVGEGLAISAEGVISATGTTTTGVSSLAAGSGIFLSGSTGDITIANSGVTSLTAGDGILLTGNTGGITVSTTERGTVTSVGVGYGLGIFGSVGPITTSGIIELIDTGVVPGVYSVPQLQVDEKGRILSIVSGTAIETIIGISPVNVTSGPNPVISVDAATAADPGVVRVSNALDSSSSTVAASSYAVQQAYSLAATAIQSAELIDKGSLITASAPGTPATVLLGADGQILMADSTLAEGMRWADNDVGTVTLINTGTGLTGGPIEDTGTISLADTAVTPGSYTNASFTVDPQGRIIAASSGTAPVTEVTGTAPIQVSAGQTPNISIDAASTLAAGAVQLYDGTDSTSVALALTAAQGKSLQDQIDALAVANNLTLAGTLDASTGLLLTVTIEGADNGFTVGQPLPAPLVTNAEYFVIVKVAGNYTPPGGTQVAASQGDWFLSIGTAWQFLDVGYIANYATTTEPGLITLATDAEVQAGTDSTKAVVPSALQSKISDSIATTSSTTIASSTAVKTAYDLADAALPKATYTALGDLVSGTGVGTYAVTGVGTDGQILAADSGEAGGLVWIDNGGGTLTSITAGTGLTGGTITTSGTIALADTTVTPGVYNYAGIIVDQQGRITAATNGAAPLPLTGGTMTGDIVFSGVGIGVTFDSGNSVIDISDSVSNTDSNVAASSLAVKTAYDLAQSASAGGVPLTAFTAKGDILVGLEANDYVSLPVAPEDGKVLTTASAEESGVAWVAPPVSIASLTSGSPGLTINPNPDAQNLEIVANPATETVAGVVRLNDDPNSLLTTTAATSRVAALAYQTAIDAVNNATQGGLSSNYLGYVSATNGNNTTGAFGTTLAFQTIQAAIAAAPDGATIFIAPGNYVEDLFLDAPCNLVGLNAEGKTTRGVTVEGTVTIDKSLQTYDGDISISGISIYSAWVVDSRPTISILGSNLTSGTILFNFCEIERIYLDDPADQLALELTPGNFSDNLEVPAVFNNCRFRGSIKMSIGYTDGTGGTLILNDCQGFTEDDYILQESGTVQVLNTSGTLAPVSQTGGELIISNVGTGILPCSSVISSLFGGPAGTSFLSSASSVGNGSVQFLGSVLAQGAVKIGLNVQYSITGLTTSLADFICLSNNPIYPINNTDQATINSEYLQSQQLTLPDFSLVPTPSLQYPIVTLADGTIHRVSNFDSGEY
jgi:hypothetical protein